MDTTRIRGFRRAILRVFLVLHVVGFIGLAWLALMGRVPESSAGWLTCPPISYVVQVCGRRTRRLRMARGAPSRVDWSVVQEFVGLTSTRLVSQMGLLLVLAAPSQGQALVGLPLLRWFLDLSAVVWPRCAASASHRAVRDCLFRLQQLLLLWLGWSFVSSQVGSWRGEFDRSVGLGLTMLVGSIKESVSDHSAEGRILEDGTYEVILDDRFVIRYKPHEEFDRRLFLLFLRQIRLVGGPPKRPFLRQEWLAAWFNVFQEHISRWESYLKAADWRRLMSRRTGPIVSLEEREPILQLWAQNFWLTAAEVAKRLSAAGVPTTAYAVETVGEESGFCWVRRELLQRFEGGATDLRPQDGWLVQRLFKLVEQLLAKVEAGEKLTGEERVDIASLQVQGEALGLGVVGEQKGRQVEGEKGLPAICALEKLLFGWWEDVDDGTVCCPYCQGTRVGRKSRQGRPKQFRDGQGQVVVVEVYRYYCRNKDCSHGSFTLLPAGLVPYSQWSEWWRLHALQRYVLDRGCYRRVARGLGTSAVTVYHWVSAFGKEVLPMAAIFGVVRSSGVVGVDEKWVKVPKNDKPAGERRQWMYVYFAVDVYTYDLLHIAIYPYDNTESARAFLLELKAKGYRPGVIVTDLRQDYGSVIAAVFPNAEHHECIFHALQNWSEQLREVYGRRYWEKVPEAAALDKALKEIFAAKTKRTARERYDEVMGLREEYVGRTPAVACVFESLEKHFPKLVNAIESDRIPRTNNAVEQIIRRFHQHYRGFCGFDSIETAQIYLAVWELVYRSTPFSADAKPDIRGRSPLELAGYDLQKLAISYLSRPFTPAEANQQPGQEVVALAA